MAKYYYDKYKSEWYINGTLISLTPKTEADSGVWSSYVYRIVYSDKTLGNTNIQFNNLLNGELYIYHQSTIINDAINAWNSGGETYVCYKINGKVYSYGANQPMGSFLSKSQVEKQKSSFIEEIIAEDGTYPDNGVHSDGYWYVKGNKASLPIYQNINGAWKEITDGYVKVNGEWKQIIEGYQKQNSSWKKLF